MVKVEHKAGDNNCNHSYARQNKKVIQILTRVCTKCGQEEHICDDSSVDSDMVNKIMRSK